MGFDLNNIESSIQNLLGGLSVKFISSLAGIATSISFLFIKNFLFSRLEKSINEQQHILDYIFPRKTAEAYLCLISEQMDEQLRTLNKLETFNEHQEERAQNFVNDFVPKIEALLKESVQKDIKEVLDELSKNMGDSISSGLNDTLEKVNATIEELKEIKEQSSAKPLEIITEQLRVIFSADNMKGIGENTAKLFNTGMTESISNMSEQNDKLQALIGNLDSYIDKLETNKSNMETGCSELLSNIKDSLSSQNDYLDKLQDISESINDVSDNLSTASDNIQKASDDLKGNLESSNTIIANGSDTIKTLTNSAEKINSALVEAIKIFETKAQDAMGVLFSQYTRSVNEVCGKIQGAISDLSEGQIEDLKDSIDELKDTINNLKGRV